MTSCRSVKYRSLFTVAISPDSSSKKERPDNPSRTHRRPRCNLFAMYRFFQVQIWLLDFPKIDSFFVYPSIQMETSLVWKPDDICDLIILFIQCEKCSLLSMSLFLRCCITNIVYGVRFKSNLNILLPWLEMLPRSVFTYICGVSPITCLTAAMFSALLADFGLPEFLCLPSVT